MKKAFTMVEVMIVIVILSLLTAMAVPAYHKIKNESKARQYTFYSLESALAELRNSTKEATLPVRIPFTLPGNGGTKIVLVYERVDNKGIQENIQWGKITLRIANAQDR